VASAFPLAHHYQPVSGCGPEAPLPLGIWAQIGAGSHNFWKIFSVRLIGWQIHGNSWYYAAYKKIWIQEQKLSEIFSVQGGQKTIFRLDDQGSCIISVWNSHRPLLAGWNLIWRALGALDIDQDGVVKIRANHLFLAFSTKEHPEGRQFANFTSLYKVDDYNSIILCGIIQDYKKLQNLCES